MLLKELAFVFSLVVFSSGISFTQQNDVRDADRLLGEEKFSEAGSIYKMLTEENPENGYYISSYAFCLYKLGEYDKSIEYFKKSIDVGYTVSSCMYDIACCYSLKKDAREAVKWIRLAAKNKFNNLEEAVAGDTDFDPIRNTAIFQKEVIPPFDSFKNRIEGWRTDIRFMKNRMEETHFNLFGKISKDEWDLDFETLNENIEVMNDAQVLTELFKIATKVGDGHTEIFPDLGRIKFFNLPIRMFLFEDGLYVTSVHPDYKEIAGKKITKIGSKSTDEVFKLMKYVISRDNDQWLKAMVPIYIPYNFLLYGLGITAKDNEAEFVTSDNIKFNIKGITNEELQKTDRSNWIPGRDTSNKPLYLKNRKELYWFEYLPDQKMVYMQENGVTNKKEESIENFCNRMFRFIDSNDVRYLVVDIRFNPGGNSFLNQSLVHGIIKCAKINKEGNLFVITGRHTFSAAMNLSTDLERNTDAIFAGEPTGSSPNFVGESNMILLPYSGVKVSCSSRYWQGSFISDDQRKFIAPTLGVKYFYNDYNNGTDPALNAILRYINK